MERIQTMADIEILKAGGLIPSAYLYALEKQFVEWFEAEGLESSLMDFRLPSYACMFHVEKEADLSIIISQSNDIEFVEMEVVDACSYYRIGIMEDHQMNLYYFLNGTINPSFEQLLEIKKRINDV